MLQSFIVYTFTALCLFMLGKSVCIREMKALKYGGNTYSFWTSEIIFSIILFAFIAGMRYNVGVDYPFYLSEYLSLQTKGYTYRETYESGFFFITQWLAKCGFHYFFFFAFWAAIQLGFLYYALKDKKSILQYVGLIVMLGPFFLDWMNGIRQCVVECIFVFSIVYIQKRKLFAYFLIIFLASFIHKSAVLLLPLYFIIHRKLLLSNKYVNMFILLVCVLLGNIPTWITLISNISRLISFLGYDAYVIKFDSIFTQLSAFEWGPRRLSVLMVNVVVVYFYPSLRLYFSSDKIFPIYFNLYFIGICLYNLLANTSLEFLRPVGYFTIFTIPVVAYALVYFKKSKKNVFFYFVLFLTCIYTYLSIVADHTNANSLILYKFFLDK